MSNFDIIKSLAKNISLQYTNNINKISNNLLVYIFNINNISSENKDKIGTIYKYLTTLYLNPNIKNFNHNKSKYDTHKLNKKTNNHKQIIMTKYVVVRKT